MNSYVQKFDILTYLKNNQTVWWMNEWSDTK